MRIFESMLSLSWTLVTCFSTVIGDENTANIVHSRDTLLAGISQAVTHTAATQTTRPVVTTGVRNNLGDAPSTVVKTAATAMLEEVNFTKGICRYYKKGTCLHGKTGKWIVNGHACRFLHPEKCLKYCRYGNDKINGCEGSCGLYHPILCRNSIQFKQCFQENCIFTHLAGTQRYAVPNTQYQHKATFFPNKEYPRRRVSYQETKFNAKNI